MILSYHSFSVPLLDEPPLNSIPAMVETVLSHWPINVEMAFVPLGIVQRHRGPAKPTRPCSIACNISRSFESSVVVITRFLISSKVAAIVPIKPQRLLVGNVGQIIPYANHNIAGWGSMPWWCAYKTQWDQKEKKEWEAAMKSRHCFCEVDGL